MPVDKEELPAPIKNSPEKVQRTYKKALENAHQEYVDEERAHRTAWSTVKQIAEKQGERWVLKEDSGPSDPREKMPQEKKQSEHGETYGGVDVEGSSREELEQRAKEADIKGYSDMSKDEIADELAQKEHRRHG